MNKLLFNRITGFFSANIIVLIYGIISILIELLSLIFFDCSPYINQPGFSILFWIAICLFLSILKRKKLKAIYSFFFLIMQCILILGSNFLFLSNGTAFEKSMLQQRNDAYATIEQFYITPGLVILCSSVLLSYFVFLFIYLRKCSKNKDLIIEYQMKYRMIAGLANILLIILIIYMPIAANSSKKSIDYETLLYKSSNCYQKMGITGNFVFEMLRRNAYTVDVSTIGNMDASIYSNRCDTSMYNGVSSGNNLVMILAESFEWYPLLTYEPELTEAIYPNLSKLMKESVKCDNFYSREKTDTAEALMLVGSNPTGKYLHNDFEENAYPYSLPNLFRQQAITEGDEDVVIRSFHQNDGTFYNRLTAHKSLGFSELIDISTMEEYGLINTWKMKERERNLDSKTMETMKNEMFPSDQRFFTFWITFSMHGFYNKRDNLSEYYDIFDKHEAFPEGDKYQNYLRTYAAAVADLDKAIGIMFDDLDEKGLLDTTTIVMISDHNTYYNGLSNYAKDIDTHFDPALYRVPMIIYDKKLTAAMDNASGEGKVISKFTTTADVIPTIFDLFQIPAWNSLYYGSTIFNNDKESIIYSRAYNIFLNKEYMGYSLNDLRYEAPESTEETRADFETRALVHLSKLAITDKVFYSNYFSDHSYKP